MRAKRAINAGEGKIMMNVGHSERSEEAQKSYYIPSFKCRHSVLDTESQSLSKGNPSRPSLEKGRSINNDLAIAEQVRNDDRNNDNVSSRLTQTCHLYQAEHRHER